VIIITGKFSTVIAVCLYYKMGGGNNIGLQLLVYLKCLLKICTINK
jgi:hypothetical protein